MKKLASIFYLFFLSLFSFPIYASEEFLRFDRNLQPESPLDLSESLDTRNSSNITLISSNGIEFQVTRQELEALQRRSSIFENPDQQTRLDLRISSGSLYFLIQRIRNIDIQTALLELPFRQFSQINKEVTHFGLAPFTIDEEHLVSYLGGNTEILSLDMIKHLELKKHAKARIFFDLLHHLPEGVQVKTLRLGKFLFEKRDENEGFFASEVEREGWAIDCEYKTSEQAGALWDQLYESSEDRFPHRSRARNEDWIETIERGMDRDYRVGSENMRIRFDRGLASFEVLNIGEFGKQILSMVGIPKKEISGRFLGLSFYHPRLTRVVGDMSIEMSLSEREIEIEYENDESKGRKKINSEIVEELLVRNRNVPKGREDKVALLLYVSEKLDDNGALSCPNRFQIDSLIASFGTVRFVRIKDTADIIKVLTQFKHQQIGFLGFGIHGSPLSLALPIDPVTYEILEKEGLNAYVSKNYQNPRNLNILNLERIFRDIHLETYLTSDAIIQFFSCSLGSVSVSKNFIDVFAKLVPNHFVSGALFELREINFKSKLAINSLKKSIVSSVPFTGKVSYCYRTCQRVMEKLAPIRAQIEESLLKNYLDPRQKFLFYHPHSERLVKFEAKMILNLIDSINHFPDYYTHNVLNLFQTRIVKDFYGRLRVINPNLDLLIFFRQNKIASVVRVEFHENFENSPIRRIRAKNGILKGVKGLELKMAIDAGSREEFFRLLKEGAQDLYGLALAYAYLSEDIEVFVALLTHGAQPPHGFLETYGVSNEHKTMYGVSLLLAPSSPSFRQNEITSVEVLKFYERFSNSPSEYILNLVEGWKLKVAIDAGNREEFSRLLKEGRKDPYGVALLAAYLSEDREMFEDLLAHGAQDPHRLMESYWIEELKNRMPCLTGMN